jgi:hypothetical protein
MILCNDSLAALSSVVPAIQGSAGLPYLEILVSKKLKFEEAILKVDT